MTQKYTTVSVTKETLAQINHICKVAKGMKKAKFMEELINEIYEASGEFTKMAIMYDSERGKIQIHFIGKSNLVAGAFQMPTETSDREVDAEVKQRVESELNRREVEKA